ncbi:MAG: hypothetical protein M1827_001336 [Pycnora praestabilis]|nr:MAG: hypothetical protein M1827_001336 [Pycnora praestabilis]
MKLSSASVVLLYASTFVASASIPHHDASISRRDAEAWAELLDYDLAERFDESLIHDLEKRKGGGGGGGGGRGGGSSSSSSSGGSSGSSSSGSKGTSSGDGTTSSSSSSGVRPSYGGGRYYGGGSTSAYAAGGRSPLGITPYLFVGAGIGLFAGAAIGGAYFYPYNHPYTFHNDTIHNSTYPNGANETLPVSCVCHQYSACGCDDNNNSTYLDSLVGNGSAADMNSSLVTVSDVNGTNTLLINGTLPNGTTTSSNSAGVPKAVIENAGWWVIGAVVGWSVLMM